ncbi:hypothetical protein [Bacillus manliponensis]|nr:hypothetical protein [Bacillus manliponensis]
MTKEQLAQAAAKVGLKVLGTTSSGDIFKICLDGSYKEEKVKA